MAATTIIAVLTSSMIFADTGIVPFQQRDKFVLDLFLLHVLRQGKIDIGSIIVVFFLTPGGRPELVHGFQQCRLDRRSPRWYGINAVGNPHQHCLLTHLILHRHPPRSEWLTPTILPMLFVELNSLAFTHKSKVNAPACMRRSSHSCCSYINNFIEFDQDGEHQIREADHQFRESWGLSLEDEEGARIVCLFVLSSLGSKSEKLNVPELVRRDFGLSRFDPHCPG